MILHIKFWGYAYIHWFTVASSRPEPPSKQWNIRNLDQIETVVQSNHELAVMAGAPCLYLPIREVYAYHTGLALSKHES